MSSWPSSKATRVLAALYRIGWSLKRQSGSHKVLSRPGWPDLVFAFTIAKKSARACSRASPSIPVCARRTCELRLAT